MKTSSEVRSQYDEATLNHEKAIGRFSEMWREDSVDETNILEDWIDSQESLTMDDLEILL